jgi:hypothetical protein
MTEETVTWKELTSTGGLEVRSAPGVIVIRDAKTGQHLVFSDADYAVHRCRILEHSGPLVLLRLLERATVPAEFARYALGLARCLWLR